MWSEWIKKSIEFTEKIHEEKVQNMQRKNSSLEEKVDEIYDYQIDPDGRSRRNNLWIVFKLLSLKDKVKVLENCQKLRGSHIYINEDFCQATLQYRKELWKEVKRLREEEDKIAYLQYRSIVVKDKNNVR